MGLGRPNASKENMVVMNTNTPSALKLVAFYASPRRQGNTSMLLQRAVDGARQEGAAVEEIFLQNLSFAPCVEEEGCRKTGRCVIEDDFQKIFELLEQCDGVLLASPLFFGTVSAQAKILMDRCQCFWVGKYRLGKRASKPRLGLFISAAARPERPDLFAGAVRSTRYFFDALDVALWKTFTFARLEEKEDVLGHPEFLREAFEGGRELVKALRK